MTERVNICIPAYYSGPDTPRVVSQLVDSINLQTYKDLWVYVAIQIQSDLDGNRALRYEFDRLQQLAQVIYTDATGPAQNTQRVITMPADGYCKIMNQDDFFDSPTAIEEMVEQLESSGAEWLINSCIHTDSEGIVREREHHPYWPGQEGMIEGINRFGCPSVVMFKSRLTPQCDVCLELCMDCDMWIQMYQKGGQPTIRNKSDVVVRMWENQLSNQLDYAKCLEADKVYMRRKYGS